MSVAAVTAYLETLGLGDRVRVLSHSSATVEEAAQALPQAQAVLSYFSTRQQKKQEFCHKKAESHIG